MSTGFVPTRAAGLDRLATVRAQFGHDYATNRNTDAGPDGAPTTSTLSPWLRRRLLLEQEVVAAALADHGPIAAEKFVQEVFWRTYFKGYLETHPAIWTRYLASVAEGWAGPPRILDAAMAGRTGIDCFDDWARTLVETGWLHNHARMWFASIWIFTLGLPWALGADFFLRHLLDGDPASNTLSWRWVAGLHTRGKVYAARAENIRRFTDGRYAPTGLNENPLPLTEADIAPLVPLAEAAKTLPAEVALLLHLDDLNPETLDLRGARVVRIAALMAHAPNAAPPLCVADGVAMDDALARASAHFGVQPDTAERGWADGVPIITAWAPVGPSADALPSGCLKTLRSWDAQVWPHATRGYFQVKMAIPAIIRQLR